jgi:hypothetical protein
MIHDYEARKSYNQPPRQQMNGKPQINELSIRSGI